MDLKVISGDILKIKSDAAVFFMQEGDKPAGALARADKALGGAISRAIGSKEFTAEKGQTALFQGCGAFKGGPEKLLVVGLGKKEKFRPDNVVSASAKAAAMLRGLNLKAVSALLEDVGGLPAGKTARLLAEGAVLGLYRFTQFKAPEPMKKELKNLTLVTADKSAVAEAKKTAGTGTVVAESVCFARDMINTPANEMTPAIMARQAVKAARGLGVKSSVLEAANCRKLGMGAFLGVAAGSVQPPKFIILEYNGAGKRAGKPVVLVGKAITFDSGGISIKPVQGMEKMKYDMAGGAVVIATTLAAARLKLPVNLVTLVPATENLPSGSAYKPGDVIRAMNGKTIEIISTDAEGRMVLADALCYAQRYNPRQIIDIATLTGGCVVALGSLAIGLMGNDPGIISGLKSSGDETFERVWELPMWEEYLDAMKGDVTDLKNAAGREAQTITAGKFLEEFVGGYPWAHLDIAGTEWEEKGRPHYPKGAAGTGVRLLVEYLSSVGK